MNPPFPRALILAIALLGQGAFANDKPAPLPLPKRIAEFADRLAKLPRERQPDYRAIESILLLQRASLTSLSDDSQSREIDRALASLSATLSDPASREELVSLREEIAAARAAAESAAIEKITRDIDAASAACASARTLADLDQPLAALAAHLSSPRGDQSNELQRARQRAASAHRFVMRWQDYLAAVEARKKSEADGILRDLANFTEGQLLPRSRLVALAQSTPESQAEPDIAAAHAEVVTALESALTLDDLIAVLRRVSRPNGNVTHPSFNQLAQTVRATVRARQNVLLDVRATSYSFQSPAERYPAEDPLFTPGVQKNLSTFNDGSRLLLFRALVSEFSDIEPQPGEKSDDFALRVLQTLADSSRWKSLRGALEAYSQINDQSRRQSWVQEDIRALGSFLAGENLLAANQHLQAVASYRSALQASGRFFSTAPINARLAEIERTHPDALQVRPSSGLQTPRPPAAYPRSDIPPGAERLPAPTGAGD